MPKKQRPHNDLLPGSYEIVARQYDMVNNQRRLILKFRGCPPLTCYGLLAERLAHFRVGQSVRITGYISQGG